MPIKFSCPHCKKGLSVKDHLAGRRAACPACKKPLTIPKGSSTNHAPLPAVPTLPTTPTAVPHHDAESAAAEAFADEVVPEAKQTQTVDFNCPFCDEELKLDVELAGKKTSCPKCRRIITVPQVETDKPKDWRQAAGTGPSGAKRPDVPKPEGAWGSTAATHVSRDALDEAGVLPDRKVVPRTTGQKVRLGIGIGLLCVCVPLGGYFGYRMLFGSSDQRTLNKVSVYADSNEARDKVGRPAIAVLHLGLAEKALQVADSTTAANAKEQFEKAIKQAHDAGAAGESDSTGVLIDLAVLATELIGTKEQVRDGLRLDEKESHKLLRQVMEAIAQPEARLEALRLVSRRLIAAKQGPRALALAAQTFGDVPSQTEAAATVGLEALAANDSELAGKAAEQALAPFNVVAGAPTPPEARVAALTLSALLNHNKPKSDEEDAKVADIARQARQLGAAAARANAEKLDEGPGRLRALLAAAGENNPDAPTIEAALAAVPSIADALKGSERLKLSWTVLHLIRLGAEAGVAEDRLGPAADALPDAGLRARGRLLALRGRLTHTDQSVGDDALTAINATSAAQFEARLELARHNQKANSGYARTVEGWEEQYRPFGRLGTLLK